jgi:hypothetical protein
MKPITPRILVTVGVMLLLSDVAMNRVNAEW